jgi:dihydrodipicolinate synthase/N-acetylneuraminate lyase
MTKEDDAHGWISVIVNVTAKAYASLLTLHTPGSAAGGAALW